MSTIFASLLIVSLIKIAIDLIFTLYEHISLLTQLSQFAVLIDNCEHLKFVLLWCFQLIALWSIKPASRWSTHTKCGSTSLPIPAHLATPGDSLFVCLD